MPIRQVADFTHSHNAAAKARALPPPAVTTGAPAPCVETMNAVIAATVATTCTTYKTDLKTLALASAATFISCYVHYSFW